MNCICGFKIFGNTQNSFNFFSIWTFWKFFVSFCECEIILEVLWCFQKVFLCSNLYCTWLFHISFSVLIHPADYCTKLELWRRLTNQAHSDWVFLFVTKEKKKKIWFACGSSCIENGLPYFSLIILLIFALHFVWIMAVKT